MSENVSVHRDGGTGEEVALVVPVYSKGAVTAEVTNATRATSPHIIAVDDGCTDDSAILARRTGATVLHCAVNLGQGAVLQTGISFFLQHTDFPYLATLDSDGQHGPTDVVAMWEQAKRDDLDIVFGSQLLSTHQEMGLPKKIVLKTAAWVTAKSTKMRLTDAHNRLRLLSHRVTALLRLHQDRIAHASEIVAQLGRSGLLWAETPANTRYTAYSKTKGQSLWNSINIAAGLTMGVR